MSGALDDTATPRLLSGVRTRFDKVRDTWVLLAPERTIRLDPIGAAILAEVDGERPFSEIVSRLATAYDAPAERIATDARAFLSGFVERRMAEVTP